MDWISQNVVNDLTHYGDALKNAERRIMDRRRSRRKMQNIKRLRRSTEASRDFTTTILAEIWRRRIRRALGGFISQSVQFATPALAAASTLPINMSSDKIHWSLVDVAHCSPLLKLLARRPHYTDIIYFHRAYSFNLRLACIPVKIVGGFGKWTDMHCRIYQA